MALLSHDSAVCAAAALLAAACGAGEVGHVELERAVVAQDPAGDEATARIDGFMFSTRQSSRFEPDGVLLYFELALDDGTGAELEIDLPRDPGREAVVHYSEATDSRLTFESDSAAGAVELAEDLDGRLCSCADGRFDLRLTDDGADGEAGTADDQVRELRNGIYHWDEQPCERESPPGPVPLADLDRVEVRPVDHCMGRPQEPAVATPVAVSTRGASAPQIDWHTHDQFYDHHSHHVVYVESYGCGGPSEPQTSSATGCGESSSLESDTEASGCEGDTQSSSSAGCGGDGGLDDQDGGSASGCEGTDSDGTSGSSGCGGDDHDSSSGCEQDASSSAAPLSSPGVCAEAAPECSPRARRRPPLLAGAFQNYLWLAFGAAFPSWRARRRPGKAPPAAGPAGADAS